MRRAVRLACVVLIVSGASPAVADIDPPRGLEWLPDTRVAIENVADFPDWVFVAWPCNQLPHRALAMEPYCVVREDGTRAGADLDPDGSLYALPARATKVVHDPKGGVMGQPAWIITQPDLRHDEAFFKTDRRVVRSAFVPNAPGVISVPRGLGLQAGVFWVRIDGVDETGLRAHFARVVWTCKSGDTIELAWDASRPEPPLPTCPTVGLPQVLGELPSASPPPERDRQSLWLGLAIAGVSLLTGGILLRREAKPAR